MNEKPNIFVRILIVLLSIALFVLVYTSFFLSNPPYGISPGMLTLIGLITVLVLSESFNQLSLGKILSLKRDVEKKEQQTKEVKEENKELREQLFSIVSNIQQSQVNNTFNAPPESWLKLLGVVPAEDKPDEEDTEEVQEDQTPEREAPERAPLRDRFRDRKAAEQIALKKYISVLDIPQSEILTRVEFSSAFQGIDPIMDRRFVFDAYLKGAETERFLEFRIKSAMSPMFFDRLYIMLSKIYLYGKAKNIHTDLVLILVSMPEEDEDRRTLRAERIFDWFQPAIANKLLKIEYIDVTAEEIQEEIEAGQQRLL